MTDCLGILWPVGLVMASDPRSNPGIDRVALVKKLAVFEQPGQRVVVILSASNLAALQKDDPYWMQLRNQYADGLTSLVAGLPPPPAWS